MIILKPLFSYIYLLFLLSVVFGDATEDIQNQSKDCTLSIKKNNFKFMPIPFIPSGSTYQILYPNKIGFINIQRDQKFKLTCVGNNTFDIVAPSETEITVICVGGNELSYRGQNYEYNSFKCQNTPKSDLKLTNEKCQTNHSIVTIGFPTNFRRINMLKICFDMKTKNSLFASYVTRSPYSIYNFHVKGRPSFISSQVLYGKVDLNRIYRITEQKKTIAKILGSESQMTKYFDGSKHILARGHFAPKADFMYYTEQYATFYFANVAPQWQLFNGGLWSNLEMKTRDKLSHDTSKYVIITGTYGVCTLEDVNGDQKPIHLLPPNQITVPLYYWKLVHNLDTESGTVYIGLNNPHINITDDLYICPNTCPESLSKIEDANDGFMFCCTQNDFEKVYGKIDTSFYNV